MTKPLITAITAGVLLFVFFLELPGPARGQGTGLYRGGRRRRVGEEDDRTARGEAEGYNRRENISLGEVMLALR